MNPRLTEVAAILRRCPSAVAVRRTLNLCPLSVPELAIVLRRSFRPGTVRHACRLLRVAGLVRWTGRYIKRAKVWEAS